jgi:hypothetical protein
MSTFIQNAIIESLVSILQKIKQLFMLFWADLEIVE